MEQGQKITEEELQEEDWIRVWALKGGQIWIKDRELILFDPDEQIVLSTHILPALTE